MDITYLVGNGFDIAAGMKTSYRDFYKWLCEQKTNDTEMERIKASILADKNLQYWSDFEYALGQYSENYTHENAEKYAKLLGNLATMLNQYLSTQKSTVDINRLTPQTIFQFRRNLDVFYTELAGNETAFFKQMLLGENININLISFNYTKVLDSLISDILPSQLQLSKLSTSTIRQPVVHVHGYLDKYPILGINDISQLNNKDLLKARNFSDAIVKPEMASYIGESWQSDAEQLIKNSDIICIYGMSLGATDKKWWDMILEGMKADRKKHVVIFWHSDTPLNMIQPYTRKKQIEEVKEKLLRYNMNSRSSSNYSDFVDIFFKSNNAKLLPSDDISNRIHVVYNTEKVLVLPKSLSIVAS